jgi:ectoine hydroxylase-related dioxygenase (phytanoyl-CoA dioxygenase family)
VDAAILADDAGQVGRLRRVIALEDVDRRPALDRDEAAGAAAEDRLDSPWILVEEILGPEVIAWGSLILKKPPDNESMVPWHQDGAYRPGIRPRTSLSAWIALSDSRAEHGCLRVIPGSHQALLRHGAVGRRATMLNRGQEIVEAIREEDAVDVELHAGEMSLHDLNTIHSSAPNRSTGDRIGFIIRYAMPQAEPPAGPSVVVRGAGMTSRADMHALLATKTSLEDAYRDHCRDDVVLLK